MTTTVVDPLEKLIREAGQGWLIDGYRPRARAIGHIQTVLHRMNEVALTRLGSNAPALTSESLAVAYEKNPHKVRAFFQVVDSAASPEILLMVWRILQGTNIAAIQMNYDAEGLFHLHVTLSSTDAGGTEEYETNDIDDAVVLRHLGTLKMDGKGIFDGFYALNIGNK